MKDGVEVSLASWVDTADVSVPFDQEEFEELLATSRGFLRLHADSEFGRASRVRTVIDEVIEIAGRGEFLYPVVLAHPYRVWIDVNKVLKRGVVGSGPSDEGRRELRLRIAKKIDFSATRVGSRAASLEKESRRERSAEHVAQLGSRELYNYGTLLALAEEQTRVMRQFTDGDMGLREKARMNSRTDSILRQLLAIGRLKEQQGFGGVVVDALRSDLACISEVGLLGRQYSRGALRVLEAGLKALEGDLLRATGSSASPRAQ